MVSETVTVYFDDLDAMGVVHNGRYAVLLERAIAAFWGRAGWSYDPGSPHFGEMFFVVKEFSITFSAPIARAGAVQVQLWIERLGTTSIVYGFRVRSQDGAVVHAKGRRVQVRLDPGTLRPAEIGAEIRKVCRPLLAAAESTATGDRHSYA